MNNPTGSQAKRRVFLSNPLKNDIRLSGTASADLGAALGGTATAANLSVMIVDLGASTQVSRTSDGVTLAPPRPAGASAPSATRARARRSARRARRRTTTSRPRQAIEDACYLDPVKPTTDVTSWRVTRGIRDSQNRDSLWYADATALAPGENFRVQLPDDAERAHVQGRPSDRDHRRRHEHEHGLDGTGQPNNVPVTLDARTSKVTLPIVGGQAALQAAGAFTDATGGVGGTVPATLSLTLGAPAAFGAFIAGCRRGRTRPRRWRR